MAFSASQRAELESALYGGLVSATDVLPPRLRYGYVHRGTRLLLEGRLPTLDGKWLHVNGEATGQARQPIRRPTDGSCLLVVDRLELGGIASVVEMLAERLPHMGVRPIVLSRRSGPRAEALRSRGIEVLEAADEPSARAAISRVRPGAIQLHNAPRYMESAALSSRLPLVLVLHNMEIHFTRKRWSQIVETLDHKAARAVAVSETVRDFHARHLPKRLHSRIVVIPNGAPASSIHPSQTRSQARVALERATASTLADAVVFLTLARYDAQKNIAGTVASYLRAIEGMVTPCHLVVAGHPSDWAEVRRTDAIRRSHRLGHRIHLLGNSDANTLLAASDAFLLNSFFEGWPVAATEAQAAGLPMVMSEVGGAKELVSADLGRSVVIPNPCGEASAVSDRAVAGARRRTRRQRNQAQLGAAVRAVTRTVLDERSGGVLATGGPQTRLTDMARAHAELIQAMTRDSTPS